ncbi:MAG: nucleoside hydrolase [Bryobacterales bacterium]|nr:nucleoside hydrolase [Bryobacterales bacterium]
MASTKGDRTSTSLRLSHGLTRRKLAGLLALLSSPGRSPGQRLPRVLIDTDAANYFDDQFALAYAATSGAELRLEAVYAAPFTNSRVSDPAQGMQLSFEEIGSVLEATGVEVDVRIRRGADRVIPAPGQAVPSPAAEDIVQQAANARPADCILVSIGPATNAASALLMDPALAGRITVVWLGGTPHQFPTASEYNLRQDVHAARVLLDSGVRLLHVPAQGIAEKLSVTLPDLERRLAGRSPIADFLLSRVKRHAPVHGGEVGSPVPLAIWDMAAIAAVVAPGFVEFQSAPSPILGPDLRWSIDSGRHTVDVATRISASAVFDDFFRKLETSPESA